MDIKKQGRQSRLGTPSPMSTPDGIAPINTPGGVPLPTETQTTSTTYTPPPPHSPEPQVANSTFLLLENNFVLGVLKYRFGDNCEPRRWQRHLSTWAATKKLILALPTPPTDWSFAPDQVYHYFEVNQVSPSYMKDVLSMLNLWGRFYFKAGWHDVAVPARNRLQRITAAYKAKVAASGKSKASQPLTEELLKKAQRKFAAPEYRWLYLSLWLGLRGKEVDQLTSQPDSWKVETHARLTFLWVRQSKLAHIAEDKRWKAIPIITSEQKVALKFLVDQLPMKRPSIGTLHRRLGHGIHSHTGRKGFSDLLMSKGVAWTAISKMLGHKNVATTLTSYADHMKVQVQELQNVLPSDARGALDTNETEGQ